MTSAEGGSGGDEVRIRVLGRVELEIDGQLVPVASTRQRELLVVLALAVGQPVSVDSIAQILWGDHLHSGSRAGVHTFASRLRKITGGDVLATTAAGYALRVPEDNIDLYRFRRLRAEAEVLRDRGSEPGEELALLRAALALWRDEPFSGLASDWLHRYEAPRLVEEWFAVLERRLDLELAARRHNELLPELWALTARYRLREALWARLVLALYRSGRQAEGFAAYHTIADSLREEYGADPGEELVRVHQLILRGDPESSADPDAVEPGLAGAARPIRVNTLPRDLETFAGRVGELAAVEAAGLAGTAGAAVVCALEGAAGVGKTTLAVRAAHGLAAEYPDGQLYLDLHGYTPGHAPLDPLTALRVLLEAYHVDPARIPTDLAEAAALWRSTVAGRRVLLVLDNANRSAQVRPLLPGGTCLVLVVSRRRLSGLDGARVVPVELMDEEDAGELFVRASGRAAPGHAEIAELVRLCGRLPLALSVAAARLRHRPAWTAADLLARLHDQRHRMDELRAEDRSVAAVLAVSLEQLSSSHRGLLFLIGTYVCETVDAYSAAALADTTTTEAASMLEALADVHLIEEPSPGRYRMHDLLRLYCRQHLGSTLDGAHREEAVKRMLRYYLNALNRADLTVRQHNRTNPISVTGGPPDRGFPTLQAALDWCDAEHANLVAAVDLTEELGERDLTCQFAALLWTYLDRAGHRTDMIHVQQLGLAAARAVDDPRWEVLALNSLGLVFQDLGENDDSLRYLHEGLERSRQCGLRSMELSVLNNIGSTLTRQGDYEAALDCFRQVADGAEDLTRRAGALGNLGEVYRLMGNLREALQHTEHARQLLASADDTHGTAMKSLNLAETYRLIGDTDQALEHARAALAGLRETGDRVSAAEALTYLGSVLHDRGDPVGASRAWREALDFFDRIGSPRAAEVRRRLEATG
jgi:DNA-binding SARP family transcriptional activator